MLNMYTFIIMEWAFLFFDFPNLNPIPVFEEFPTLGNKVKKQSPSPTEMMKMLDTLFLSLPGAQPHKASLPDIWHPQVGVKTSSSG